MENKYPVVYSITMVDLSDFDNPLGFQKTAAIFTDLNRASYAVKNNEDNLADSGAYQYAVIEKTALNLIRPLIDCSELKLWFKYNSILDEFEPCVEPKQFIRVSGFGIG